MSPRGHTISGDRTAAPLHQAVLFHQQGRLREALGHYQQALDADPSNFDALHGMGILYGQLGRFDEALKFITVAGTIQPNNGAAHFNRAKALQELKNYPEALAGYDKVLSLMPDNADAYNNRGNVLKDLQRYDEALASFTKAIELRPDFVGARLNRGAVLFLLKRYDEALAAYNTMLSRQPGFADVYNNRGNVLKELRRYDEALADFAKALSLKPDYAEAYNNRGNVLRELQRYDEAVASYETAAALKPGYADAYMNMAVVKLLLGDFESGWPLYEWRWKAGQHKNFVNNIKQPLWLGDQWLAGRTILLHTEQGLGDVIQFARYVPQVEALGANVILGVPTSLVSVLRTLKGDFTLVSEEDIVPEFDLHCPFMSLPLAFKTTVDTIPAQVPYLSADPYKQAAWRQRLGPKVGSRIGLVWSGNAKHRNDRNRSLALRALAPLLDLDYQFHSLQKELRTEDQDTLAAYMQIKTHEDELNDFADTAALIAELDLVITVDTSVAHLAGALGKPVWILLPYIPDFRWMAERSDSPWYPTARLFRQRERGDWEGVIKEVGAALQASEFAE